MRANVVHFNDDNTNKILFKNYYTGESSNDHKREKMKKILARAINNELTDRQRKCLKDYYIYNKKEKDIAVEIGISPSTVSRHISNAREKLKHIASYYI